MDLDGLRALVAVADTGSFSAAAKSLKFAGATLLRHIDELEEKSGVELLRRAKDRASVTRAGELLANRGRTFLHETVALIEAVRALEHQDDLISIQIPLGLPPHIEQTAHRTFRKAAPQLRWHLSYLLGAFDPKSQASFVLHYGKRPPDDVGWHHTKIARIRTGLIASEAYLKEKGRPTCLEEALDHSLLIWERHDRNPNRIPLVSGEEGPELRPILLSPSAHLIQQFVANGVGIGLAPTSKWGAFLHPGDTPTVVLPEVVGDDFELWMSVKSGLDAGAIGILAIRIAQFARAALGSN
jgi:DNA-binding transcriptional LysR family regulator